MIWWNLSPPLFVKSSSTMGWFPWPNVQSVPSALRSFPVSSGTGFVGLFGSYL